MRTALAVGIVLVAALIGCAGSGERKTEKDLQRDYRVAYAGERTRVFSAVVARLDQMRKGNAIADAHREVRPDRGSIGYALQFARSETPDPDVLYYAIDIAFSDTDYVIEFTLWPEVAAGPHENGGIGEEDLDHAYAIWSEVAKALAAATGGHAAATSSAKPQR